MSIIGESNIKKIKSSYFLKVFLSGIIISLFFIDFKGVFLNDISSDLIYRFSDFRAHSYHYYINGFLTTNSIYKDLLLSNKSLLPKLISYLANVSGSFDFSYNLILVLLTTINVIALPYLIYSFDK